MLLNLIFTERHYINKIIKENFNKSIEKNPDLSKFDINKCHLCNEKIESCTISIRQSRILFFFLIEHF